MHKSGPKRQRTTGSKDQGTTSPKDIIRGPHDHRPRGPDLGADVYVRFRLMPMPDLQCMMI